MKENKQKEIIHVELVDEKNTEAMIAIGVEKGGRTQIQGRGTAPALLSALTIMLGEQFANILEDIPMPVEAKLEMFDILCGKAEKILRGKLTEAAKKEADDDDMPSDLKDALGLLEKLIDKLGGM